MGFLSSIGDAVGGALGGGIVGAAGNIVSSLINNKNQNQMAGSAMQIRVADMRKAGLNPVLAAQNGGLQAASVPQQQSPDLSPLVNGFQAHSARMQAKTSQLQLENQIKQTNSNIALQSSQSANALADAQVKQSQLGIQEAQKNLINQQVLTEATRRANLAANTGLASANAVRSNLQAVQDKVMADYLRTDQGVDSARRSFDNKTGGIIGNANAIGNWLNTAIHSSSSGSTHSAKAVRKSIPNSYQKGLIKSYGGLH